MTMNGMLWALQMVLAVLYVAGGAYKLFAFEEVARTLPAVPHGGWRAFGAFELVAGLMLVLPGILRWAPAVTAFAASMLALETLVLVAIYASYSRVLTAANPLVWAVAMAVLVTIVAYGRFTNATPA